MTTPTLFGLHHVTFPVADLDGAMAWFETVFGAQHLAELDQHDEHGFRLAVVLRLPGVVPMVGLRHVEDVSQLRHAEDVSQMSEVALGVADRAELARWAAHFDGRDVAHSDVMAGGLGHVMKCTMPGGPTLMLFAD